MNIRLLTVISLFAVVTVALPPSLAEAQIGMGDGLLTFSGAYVTGTSAITSDTVDGNAISLTYEKLDWAKPISFGFNVGYAWADGDSGTGSSNVKTSTKSIPFYLGGKYWLGKNRFQFYVGAALGVYFSWLDREIPQTGETYESVGNTGFGMGIPIGAAVSISKSMFISGNYTLNWMWSNELFDNDLLHAFNLGLGFKLNQ